MDQNEAYERKRPFGLYIIIIFQMVIAVLLGLVLLEFRFSAQDVNGFLDIPVLDIWYAWALVGLILLAVIGLLSLKRWGWILTMFLTGFGLAFSIWNYFQGRPNYFALAIYIVIVFYLNQRDVQLPFQGSPHPGDER